MNTDLTPKETAVINACRASYVDAPGCYVDHTFILEHSGIAPRSLGGIITSLQKKGFVSTFHDSGDVEMTCQARKHLGLELKKHPSCNHPECFCS